MNSPFSARDVSIKQEEPEDKPHFNTLHMAVCKEEDPYIKEEQEELQRPAMRDGSLPAVKSEDNDEDISSHRPEVEVKLESDSEVEVKLESDSKVEVKLESDSKVEVKLESDSEVEVELQSDSEVDVELESDSEVTVTVTEDSDDWEENGGEQCVESRLQVKMNYPDDHTYFRVAAEAASSLDPAPMVKPAPMLRPTPAVDHASMDPSSRQQPHNEAETSLQLRVTSLRVPGTLGLPPAGTQVLESGLRKRFPCPDCGKRLPTAESLRAHLRVHTGERPFACSGCDHRFTQLSGLRRHMCTHADEEPRFAEANGLRAHRRTKPYTSTVRAKSFTTQKNMAAWHAGMACTRTQTHSGATAEAASSLDPAPMVSPAPAVDPASMDPSSRQQPHNEVLASGLRMRFPCPHCGKSLPTAASLLAHLHVHAGERPFASGEEPRFAEDNGLHAHRRTKPYPCTLCAKSFRTQKKMARHVLKHGGVECMRTQTHSDIQAHDTSSGRGEGPSLRRGGRARTATVLEDPILRDSDPDSDHADTDWEPSRADIEQIRYEEKANGFSCEHCGKGFTNRHNLKHHKMKHMEVTPFKHVAVPPKPKQQASSGSRRGEGSSDGSGVSSEKAKAMAAAYPCHTQLTPLSDGGGTGVQRHSKISDFFSAMNKAVLTDSDVSDHSGDEGPAAPRAESSGRGEGPSLRRGGRARTSTVLEDPILHDSDPDSDHDDDDWEPSRADIEHIRYDNDEEYSSRITFTPAPVSMGEQPDDQSPSASGLPPTRGRRARSTSAARNTGGSCPPVWRSDGWEPRDIPFTGSPGPLGAAAAMPENAEMVKFLELFMTDELIHHIVEQTNLYADGCIGQVDKEDLPSSRVWNWKAVTLVEMKNYLGLCFLTGVIKLPQLWMYWSTQEVISTPHFPRTMSRNRFQLITRFLHFNQGGDDAVDRIWRVRPILDHFSAKFKELYYPSKNIAVDEGTLLWRGRLSLKVYNPTKPIKYGIKSYILADSHTGYCYSMKPYIGRRGKLEDTVLFLLGDLKGRGHHLYMDNYYNSLELSARLLELKTHTCGTLRKSPTDTAQVTVGTLKPGEHIMQHNGTAMVIAWRDKKIVKTVSTIHRDMTVTVEERDEETGVREKISKPECVLAYNKWMKGVDQLDQNIGYYLMTRKAQKWTTKYVFYLFQIAIFNSFVLYRCKAKKPKSMMKYTLGIADVWTNLREFQGQAEGVQADPVLGDEAHREDVDGDQVQGAADQRGLEAGGSGDPQGPQHFNPRAPREDPKSRLTCNLNGHGLQVIPQAPGTKKKRPTRPCRVCQRRRATEKNRSETRYWCKVCHVGLHPQCFDVYHTKRNYWE